MTNNLATPIRNDRKLLVVDDDGPILRALQARLAHSGYDVEIATDGISALLSAQAKSPAVAVLDITMPGLDGFEVAKKLKAVLPEIGLVFLSASKALDAEKTASQLGGKFVEKPFDSEFLMEKINEAYG